MSIHSSKFHELHFRFNNATNINQLHVLAVLFMMFLMVFDVSSGSISDKNYLRIQQNISYDENDLKIKSIGALAFSGSVEGHADLSYLESEENGNEWVLDFGGGYVFDSDLSLFLGAGISLGYNKGKNDYIAAYYPEVGIVLDITNTFGITVSAKRYYNLLQENEDIVMLGLVFRD